MKTILLATLGLVMMISSVSAARVEFVGAMNVLSVTPACTAAAETSVNSIYHMRYNPPNLGVADNRTSVTFHEPGGSQNYTLPTGTLIDPTIFRTVAGSGIYRQAFTFTATMRITKQLPAILKTVTPSVSILGDITSFDGVAGCNISFSASGVRH